MGNTARNRGHGAAARRANDRYRRANRSRDAPDTGGEACCYDTIVSESRIASYIGIAKGEIPARHYFGTWRSFPDTCDWSWQETKPLGVTRRYLGVDVFEGATPTSACA